MKSKTLIMLVALVASNAGAFLDPKVDELRRGDSFQGQQPEPSHPENLGENSINLKTDLSDGTQQEPNNSMSDPMNINDGTDGSRMEDDSEGQQQESELKSGLQSKSGFGSENQETNGSNSYDTGKYDHSKDKEGAYDHKLDEEGAYDHNMNKEGAYDHKLDEEGAYDHKLDEEGAYDHNMNKEGAYDPKYTSPGLYQNNQESDDFNDKQKGKKNPDNSKFDATDSKSSGIDNLSNRFANLEDTVKSKQEEPSEKHISQKLPTSQDPKAHDQKTNSLKENQEEKSPFNDNADNDNMEDAKRNKKFPNEQNETTPRKHNINPYNPNNIPKEQRNKIDNKNQKNPKPNLETKKNPNTDLNKQNNPLNKQEKKQSKQQEKQEKTPNREQCSNPKPTDEYTRYTGYCPENDDGTEVDQELMVQLVNGIRSNNPVSYNHELSGLAQEQSNDMVRCQNYDHNAIDREAKKNRDTKGWSGTNGMAENIHIVCTTDNDGHKLSTKEMTRKAFEGWLGSPLHKENMMRGNMKNIAVARKGNMWTMKIA